MKSYIFQTKINKNKLFKYIENFVNFYRFQ